MTELKLFPSIYFCLKTSLAYCNSDCEINCSVILKIGITGRSCQKHVTVFDTVSKYWVLYYKICSAESDSGYIR